MHGYTRAVLDCQSPFVANRDRLTSVFSRVQFISSDEHRQSVAQSPGIFVTTSGMLQCGPAIHYLEQMWSDEKSATLLTGYQVKGTNGFMLDTERIAYIGGYRTKVRCQVERFDFSGHLSQEDIKQAVLSVRPKVLILNHGNMESIATIAAWAKQTVGCEVFAPKVGEQITIEPGVASASIQLYDEHPGQYLDEHQHEREHDHLHAEYDE